MKKDSFVRGVDGLRGIAAIMVLLFHYYGFSGSGQFRGSFIARAGWTGVDIFFVISGFVLFLPFLRAEIDGKNVDIKSYFKRRFFRIVPAYWFSLLFILTVLYPDFYLKMKLVIHVLANAFFLEGFVPVFSSFKVNGVAWTLFIEAQFYLILPLFYKLFVGRTWIRNAVIILVLVTLYKYFGILLTDHIRDSYKIRQFWINSQLPGVLQEFTFGIVAANIYVRYRDKLNAKLSVTLSLLGIVMFVLGMVFIVEYGATNYWFGKGVLGYAPLATLNTYYAFAATILILGIAIGSKFVVKVFDNAVLKYLGMCSYGIYLWHYPIGIILKNSGSNLSLLSFVVYGGLISIIWATISYYLIEKPFISLSKTRKDHNIAA